MTGLFAIFFLIIGIISFLIHLAKRYDDWDIAAFIFLFIFLAFLAAIPISRLDTKANANYAKVLQETIDNSRDRNEEFNVIERNNIIEEINKTNSKINNWKIKGGQWYHNKWYYHPSTQDAKFIK